MNSKLPKVTGPKTLLSEEFITLANSVRKSMQEERVGSGLEQKISDLAHAMAYKACEGKDIRTTAEGRSVLKARYEMAKAHIEYAVENYLDKVS